jgi:hypothetical protein
MNMADADMGIGKTTLSVNSKKSGKGMKYAIIGFFIFLVLILIIVSLYIFIKSLTTTSTTPTIPAAPTGAHGSFNGSTGNTGGGSCPSISQAQDLVTTSDGSGTIPYAYFMNVPDAESCQNICNSNGFCQWSTYTPSTKSCILNQGTYKDNVVSGFRIQNSTNPTSCPSYTTFNNTVISNGQGTNYTANSLSDCENMCTTNSCLFFSLDGSQCNINNGVTSNGDYTVFPVGNGKAYIQNY